VAICALLAAAPAAALNLLLCWKLHQAFPAHALEVGLQHPLHQQQQRLQKQQWGRLQHWQQWHTELLLHPV
jgi:hypothetical protein